MNASVDDFAPHSAALIDDALLGEGCDTRAGASTDRVEGARGGALIKQVLPNVATTAPHWTQKLAFSHSSAKHVKHTPRALGCVVGAEAHAVRQTLQLRSSSGFAHSALRNIDCKSSFRHTRQIFNASAV